MTVGEQRPQAVLAKACFELGAGALDWASRVQLGPAQRLHLKSSGSTHDSR